MKFFKFPKHGRCSFWNFPQSHHNSSKQTANRPGGRTFLGFCLSSIKNLVLLLSNERTVWVFAFDCASSNAFAATSKYTCPTIIMTSTCLLLSLKNLLQRVYVAITIEEIGRFLVFFKTKLIESTRLVVICPHRWPLSHARVHFSLGISSNHWAASGFSSLTML